MKKDDIFDALISGSLKPRYHAGVGMIQAYLTDNLRLHVFHPDLPPRLEAFGNRHNHRFDMTSTVLMGAIVDIALNVGTHHLGHFRLYTVKPAHHGDTPTPQLADDNKYKVELTASRRYEAGQQYYCPQGFFHETRAEGLTVTLMRKSDQRDTWAKILAHKTQEPIHGLDHGVTPGHLAQLFFSALRKLPDSAWDVIEREVANG